MTTNVNFGFVADAAGTVDVITALYTPTYTVLVDKMLVWFRATGANASATPTFSPNGLTAHVIVKQGGQALIAGDIPAVGAVMNMVYDAPNTRWELLNPASLTPAASVLNWIKVTKTYTDFAAAATTNDIEIYSLPAKGIIHAAMLRQTTSFTGGAISAYTISIGVAGNLGQFLPDIDVFAAPPNTALGQTVTPKIEDFIATTSIRGAAISTDDDLDAATQGSVDFYLLISTLP